MMNSAAEDTDRAEEAASAVGEAAPVAVLAPEAPRLRDVVVNLAFKPAGRERILLDDFLSEPAWEICLGLWFGDVAGLGPPFEARPILQATDPDISRPASLLAAQGTAIPPPPPFPNPEASCRACL